MNHPEPSEQLARELLREAGFLSERWRLWLLEELRREFDAADLERLRLDRLNRRMGEAVAVLQRVAQHLKVEKSDEQLVLKMREFDAVPEKVRDDWTARRIADALRGSWEMAKRVAFTDTRLPVVAERKWELSKGLPRKRKEAAIVLSVLETWLQTNPKKRTQAAYLQWVKDQDRPGQRPLPKKKAIWNRWPSVPWAEILEAVEAGRVPGETDRSDAPATTAPKPIPRSERASPYVLDHSLRGRLIKQAREAKGLSLRELAEQTGIDRSHLGKIESGERKQPTFELIVKLANTLDLALDDFATRS